MSKADAATSWTDYCSDAQLHHYERLTARVNRLADNGDTAMILEAVRTGMQISDLSHLVKVHKSRRRKGK